MFEVLSSRFTAPADPAGSESVNQIVTTLGRIIRDSHKRTGKRIKLRHAFRELRSLMNEGFFIIKPSNEGQTLLGSYSQPLTIAITEKGLAALAALDNSNPAGYPGSDPPPNPPGRNLDSENLHPKAKAILDYLMATCIHYGKLYCFPSQDTIMEKCLEWYGEPMVKSTLNVHLDRLEEAGLIQRSHRHRRKADGTWEWRSTLYKLAGKAIFWLKKVATKAGKLFAALGFRKIGNNPFNSEGSSKGGAPLNGSSPPHFEEKGAAEAAGRSESNLRRLGFSLPGILTPLLK